MALQFISWEENLEENEIPPRAIWFNSDDLATWFKRVRKDREAKYGGKGSDEPGPIDDPVQNSAAKDLIVG